MDLLSLEYPGIYISYLKMRGLDTELKEYMNMCKSFREDYKKFSLYVHGYLEPHFQQLRESGLIKRGVGKVNYKFAYVGEVDD